MKQRCARDKLLESELWQSGEPFTLQDMRLHLKTSAATVHSALRDLEDVVSKTVTPMPSGGTRTTYRPRTLATEWIKRPLVGKWAMDMGRGYLPR